MQPAFRPQLRPAAPTLLRRARSTRPTRHHLHTTPRRATDGVFRALTESRTSMPWIEALNRQRAEAAQGQAPLKERDLSPKRMRDSYHSVILPLAQDPWLSDTYLNSSGHIRLGTIFMDLDALSGIIAYKHTGDGVTTVTAACDRITIKHPLQQLCDLEYSGQVTYATGRSSMEITCQVAKAAAAGCAPRDEDVLLVCTFTMVSLDPRTKRPVPIPPLEPSTPSERAVYAAGEANSAAKKSLATQNLLKHTPNPTESSLIHALWLQQLAFHDPNNPVRRDETTTRHMAATVLRTAAIMQPQYRNRHNFMVFGGLLLKQTFELAFCCAAGFAHARPRFLSLDPSTFLNPVPVGSVLYLAATVTYTDPPLVGVEEASRGADGVQGELGRGGAEQGSAERGADGPPRTRVLVRVDGKVRDIEHGETKPTGQFNFTFEVDREVRVLPQTYQEYMMYIDARRRFIRVMESEGESLGGGRATATGERGQGVTE